MTDVFVKQIGVPKRYRNGKTYGGNSFDSTNFYEVSNFGGGQRHVETARIEYETGDSRTITITFTDPFEKVPVKVELSLHRIVPKSGGRYLIQNVLFDFATSTLYDETGFEILVRSNEDINGVILNYNFTE